MAKSGPVIIIEDDEDDKDIFQEVLNELSVTNKLVWFTHPQDAMNYLKTTIEQPFIIFSDVNLPRQSGLEFKRQIDQDSELRRKSIPFVFYSTAVEQKAINEAYTQMTIQGFFRKPDNFEEIKRTIKLIFDYWLVCKHPNTM